MRLLSRLVLYLFFSLERTFKSLLLIASWNSGVNVLYTDEVRFQCGFLCGYISDVKIT